MIEQSIILLQIIFIDIILAADNAIIIGLIAANFVPKNRKKIILWGVAGALIFKVIFAIFATYLFNRRYKEGPKLSLATAAKVLRSGSDLLFMDADVLYHSDLIRKLLKSKHQNCFAMDREFQSAYASVKICLKEGHVVDFGKQVSENFDIMGEWPGFLKMSSELASLSLNKFL